jgi:arginyl-tRNA synthetase
MSTLHLPGLATRLEGLGLGLIPHFSEAHVLNKPLDIGRSYLADILGHLVGCDPVAAYNSIRPSSDIPGSDLIVLLPKLIRGADWKAARDLITRVRHSLPSVTHCRPD